MRILKTVSNTITKLLHLIDRLTNSVDNLATVVEESTVLALVESRIDNQAQISDLQKQHKISAEQLKELTTIH